MNNLTEVYTLVDNLVKHINLSILQTIKPSVGRKGSLSRTEYVTIGLIKQFRNIQTNKELHNIVKTVYQREFASVPGYKQFNAGLQANFMYLCLIAEIITRLNGKKESTFSIIDSTPVPVCVNTRRSKTKLGKNLAKPGKNLNGWYYGFKLHIIINDNMDIVSMRITDGSTSNLKALDKNMVKNIFGYLIGDKGYLSKKKSKELSQYGVQLITKPRKNMKQIPVSKEVLSFLKKRQLVETVFSSLKHSLNMINRYARSIESCFAQVISATIAYSIKQIIQNHDTQMALVSF